LGVLRIKVAPDFLESYATPLQPLSGIEELIWNSLDADAAAVRVLFDENSLGELFQVRVVDDGSGLPYSECRDSFGSLGGSAKRHSRKTPKGRINHGKSGRGRFRAYSVGKEVEWISKYREFDTIKRYSIRGSHAKMSDFLVTDPVNADEGGTGMEVVVSGLYGRADQLREDDSRLELGRKLCLYLTAYSNVRVVYDGKTLNLDDYKARTDNLRVSITLPDGSTDDAHLTVIEWNNNAGRSLLLCDEDGIAIHDVESTIRDRNFNFTAYLRSEAVSKLVESRNSFLHELDPVAKAVLAAARSALQGHFRRRESERSVDLVKGWKRDRVYPYRNNDAGPIERAEREVFDICALKVYEYLPGFQRLEPKAKKLTFGLIKEALKTSPSSLRKILGEVLTMPENQKEELAALLERTSLTSIINASKIVLDRLAFLESMNELLYGTFKKSLKERTQFQRILVEELWVFGEQYALGVDDQSLKTLLEAHLNVLGRGTLFDESSEVLDLEGTTRRVDLMLYRRFPQTMPDRHEHLVVELKRPSCKLGQGEIGQIKKYAFTVAEDERFDKERTSWTFLLVGNSLDEFAQHECSIDYLPSGHIYSSRGGLLNIHVKPWSSLIADVKWRYEFFRNALEYQATIDHGTEYLKRKHAEYLPDSPDANSDVS
jgi:hypothetical protein